jgi:hypothetical protein
MITRRALAAVSGFLAAAGVLVACTFTQSLDYLQKGGGTDAALLEGSPPDAGSEAGGRVPTVLVPNQTKPGFLAQDATTLYWIAGGMVMSVPKSGGTPKVLGAVAPTASSLVAEPDPAGAVFVVNGGTVLRMPKDGTAGGVVFTTGATDPPTDTIAASASALYVLQYDQSGTVDGARILRMAKNGSGAVDLAPDAAPSTLNLDSKSVFWLLSDVDPPSIVEQAENAAPGTTTAVYALGANDDAPTISADIAIDDDSLYWVTTDATSGAAEIVSRKRQSAASAIAIYRGAVEDTFASVTLDATHAYFLETRSSSLLRVPKNGGDVEKLVTGLKAPSGLVVDGSAIYLTVEATGNTGQVLVLTK